MSQLGRGLVYTTRQVRDLTEGLDPPDPDAQQLALPLAPQPARPAGIIAPEEPQHVRKPRP